MLQQLNLPAPAPLSLTALVINLLIGTILALILRWHFVRYASTLSNRDQFARIFPFIVLTTVLIISVVKSSLALSLGLVGALSIVRFRTPIKEPEELAYLFMAISMGLGLGADHRIPTAVAAALILGVIALVRGAKQGDIGKTLYLTVSWAEGAGEKGGLEKLNAAVAEATAETELRRFDIRDGGLEASYCVGLDSPAQSSGLADALREKFPGIEITFIDQERVPGL